MQTTSLEVSRELEKAEFWDGDRQQGGYLWGMFWVVRPNRTPEVMSRNRIMWHLGIRKDLISAATYDDLIPVLGLDKPWGELLDEYHSIIKYHMHTGGLNCDTLAKLWIELHGKD